MSWVIWTIIILALLWLVGFGILEALKAIGG